MTDASRAESNRLEEMDQIGEEINELDRRISRVYEEEALKQKLADVEAEIKRFEMGGRRSPPSEGKVIVGATAVGDERGDQERFAAGLVGAVGSMGAVGGVAGMNADNLTGLELVQQRKALGADSAAAIPQERFQQPKPPQQQIMPNMANHELSMASHELNMARQFMFDQQMLAVARQMMDMQQQGNASGLMQSLDLYQAFRGGNGDGEINGSMRTASMVPQGLSLPDVEDRGVAGGIQRGVVGGISRNEQPSQELLSASEQRQWQRLQRQFDSPDNIRQEVESEAAQSEFTLPFSSDCSHA